MFCWFFRLLISNAADADASLPARTQRHVNRCRRCREFHTVCMSLGNELRREAAVLNGDLRPQLTKRILAAVPRQHGKTKRLPVNWRPMIAAASLAVIASAAIAVLSLMPRKNGPNANQYKKATQMIQSLGAGELLDNWPKLVEGPLPREIENLTSDTTQAIRFLVACVDVSPTEIAQEVPN